MSGAAALGGAAQAALDAVVPAAFLALLWPRLRSPFPEAAVQRRVALGGAVVARALGAQVTGSVPSPAPEPLHWSQRCGRRTSTGI